MLHDCYVRAKSSLERMGLMCSVYDCMQSVNKSGAESASAVATDKAANSNHEVGNQEGENRDDVIVDAHKDNTPKPHSSGLLSFTFEYVSLATQNFNDMNLLGGSESGRTYKGFLSNSEKALADGSGSARVPVAIKRLNLEAYQNYQGWLDEVAAISTLHHPNLIKIIGFCVEDKEACLVYEYMPNGSLSDILFANDFVDVLTWNQRIGIGMDIASGLSQLHQSAAVHRNLRASNILLDENFFARITDYGLSVSGLTGGEAHPSVKAMAAEGYLDPTYAGTGKGDIYSLGVLLLELLTGQKCMNEKTGNLLARLKPVMTKRKPDLRTVVDAKLQGKVPPNGALKLFEIINKCTDQNPSARPDLEEIIFSLKAVDKMKS